MAEKQQKNVPQKVQQTAQKADDVKSGVKDSINAVKNYKSGNWVGAAKDAGKVLKNKEFRKHLIISIIAGALIPILILLLIAGAFMVVINRNRKQCRKFCKWFRTIFLRSR